VAIVGLGLGSLFVFEPVVIAQSRSLPIGSEMVFLALVHVNVIGIGLLGFLLGRNVVKLITDRRAGILGSKLNTKFVVSFVFTAVISSTALFVLSAFLVLHTIQTWFELRLGDGLQQSIEVAEGYYTENEDRVLAFGRRLAAQVESGRLMREDSLDTLIEFIALKQAEYGLAAVEVFSSQQERLASATDSESAVVALEAPDSALIQAGLEGFERTTLEEAGPGELLRGIVPIRSTFMRQRVVGVVVVNHFIPRALGQQVAGVREALEEYQRLQPSAGTFETSMLLLLLMITMVSVLFSSWMGFRLAKQITDPIQRLAGATQEVAAGNLDVRLEQRGEDELGLLVRGFNEMAADLQANREDLERRRALIEIILGGVGAGVISLDESGLVTTINPTALRLLGVPRGEWVGKKLGEILPRDAFSAVEGLLQRLAEGGGRALRRQIAVTVGREVRTLNWTVSRLADVDEQVSGSVVVIDDVTQILKGQRMAAWRDVARRIAHEIKNPLTPIQLSAQRLARKLGPKISDPEGRKLLEQCTDAITHQVDAMKVLLREFSNFAQLPATDPVRTDLNELVSETVEMYQGKQSIAIDTELDQALPMLDLDRQQIKRVILNLVENAIAAIESAGPGERSLCVSTRMDRTVGVVHLAVADSGCGIRPEDRGRLFQPGFSTKEEGTGIGLAIVSRIVSDHSGYVRVRANTPRGAVFEIELPVRT
jgi:two-component system nitrogen regulation sensor histidine kinase NtrY